MRRRHGHFAATNAEQLFQAIPCSGRDVDVANFYAKRTGDGVDRDSLADLLAAYRAEQEEKLEERISDLSDEVERLRADLNDDYE